MPGAQRVNCLANFTERIHSDGFAVNRVRSATHQLRRVKQLNVTLLAGGQSKQFYKVQSVVTCLVSSSDPCDCLTAGTLLSDVDGDYNAASAISLMFMYECLVTIGVECPCKIASSGKARLPNRTDAAAITTWKI